MASGFTFRSLILSEFTFVYDVGMCSNFILLHVAVHQPYAAAWMGVGFGGEWVYVYVWVSHFIFHLKLSQHC